MSKRISKTKGEKVFDNNMFQGFSTAYLTNYDQNILMRLYNKLPQEQKSIWKDVAITFNDIRNEEFILNVDDEYENLTKGEYSKKFGFDIKKSREILAQAISEVQSLNYVS